MPAARIGQALTSSRSSAPHMHAGSVKPHAAQGAWKSPRDAHAGHRRASSPRLRKPRAECYRHIGGVMARVLLRMSGSAARLCPAWAMAALTNFAPWAACVLPSLAACMRGATLSRVAAPVRFGWQRLAWAEHGRVRNRHAPAAETRWHPLRCELATATGLDDSARNDSSARLSTPRRCPFDGYGAILADARRRSEAVSACSGLFL